MSHLDVKPILDVIGLAEQLLALADRGETVAEDDSCRILFGLVRDCAFKLHAEADREMCRHMAKKLQTGRQEEGEHEPMQFWTKEGV